MSILDFVLQALAAVGLSGTIVVTVPSKDGLVVAADSRSTGLGKYYFDRATKLHVARTQVPILVAVTGGCEYMAPVPPNVRPEDWMATQRFDYQASAVIGAYLERRPATKLSAEVASKVARRVASTLGDYLRTHKEMPATLGKTCLVVLAQAASTGSTSYVTVPIRLESQTQATAGEASFKIYQNRGVFSLDLAGEDIYVKDHVVESKGVRNLDKRAAEMVEHAKRIEDWNVSDACFLAVSIIRGAVQAMQRVPPPNGIVDIGGEAHVYLIAQDGIRPLPIP